MIATLQQNAALGKQRHPARLRKFKQRAGWQISSSKDIVRRATFSVVMQSDPVSDALADTINISTAIKHSFMGRTRTFLRLGLAGGAAIGILALSSPRFLNSKGDVQPTGAVPTIAQETIADAPEQEAVTASREEVAIASEEGTAIAHFLGIAQFVKSPTEYGFVCNGACDTANGEVVSASLEGDRMEIEYRYLTAGTTQIGKLIGTLNSDGVFAGIYRVNENASSQTVSTQGDITFTFAADGTATGSTGQGKTSVQIIL